MSLRANSLVGELDLLPNDVVHAIRVLLRKQVDFRWVVSKAHGTSDAQIGFWEIGRLLHDQQDGEKVHANSQRCGRVAWCHWTTLLVRRGRDSTTEVNMGCTSSCGSWSLSWCLRRVLLVPGHRHLGSSESLQALGEQTCSTWPGSVLSLHVNFLRRNQMTDFVCVCVCVCVCVQISKDRSRTVSHQRISWGRLRMKFEFICSRVPGRRWLCQTLPEGRPCFFFTKRRERDSGNSSFCLRKRNLQVMGKSMKERSRGQSLDHFYGGIWSFGAAVTFLALVETESSCLLN